MGVHIATCHEYINLMGVGKVIEQEKVLKLLQLRKLGEIKSAIPALHRRELLRNRKSAEVKTGDRYTSQPPFSIIGAAAIKMGETDILIWLGEATTLAFRPGFLAGPVAKETSASAV